MILDFFKIQSLNFLALFDYICLWHQNITWRNKSRFHNCGEPKCTWLSFLWSQAFHTSSEEKRKTDKAFEKIHLVLSYELNVRCAISIKLFGLSNQNVDLSNQTFGSWYRTFRLNQTNKIISITNIEYLILWIEILLDKTDDSLIDMECRK